MKKYLFFLFIFFFLFSPVFGENNSGQQSSQIVYVCTGSYAYAYHSSSNCPGLGNCKGEIQYTDENTAVNTLGRVPCCRCWTNVGGRCKDDNPYYGSSGGGNSEAYAYFALAIVAASAIILSNDVYIYPAYSFSNGGSNNYYSSSGLQTGTGWIFGLRKKFKYSALEYGASYMKFNSNYNYDYNYGSYSYDRWGAHLNFVQQIFYNKTPYWMKIYVGPTINYVNNFGFGGIIGTEMKIFDRLKFDIRYECTTQTNQIQAGLIFTYQKKYFWQK